MAVTVAFIFNYAIEIETYNTGSLFINQEQSHNAAEVWEKLSTGLIGNWEGK